MEKSVISMASDQPNADGANDFLTQLQRNIKKQQDE